MTLSIVKLHDYGFVRLVDYMGNDSSIVQAARVSYGGGIKTPEQDRKLINYLMRNKHTSPFEMVVFKFHVKLPIFVARQWIRHRMASYNEISGRYSILPSDFYIPALEYINTQDTKNKQGRTNKIVEDALVMQQVIAEHNQDAYEVYQYLLDNGVAREIARMVLPLNIYTEWYFKQDLKNLLDFLRLRTASNAQREFQDYANAIISLIEPIVPVTISAWRETL